MRLLNVNTLEIDVFPGPAGEVVPPYAILSHTWERDEVSFDDMKDRAVAKAKSGFGKICSACNMTAECDLLYIWIDTCCIDKSSSAELSEAINSMFRWYKNSVVCFALLSDLPTGQRIDQSALQKCRWFTRGWTLQELIAPVSLVFVDQNWTSIGTKSGLKAELENITGISRRILDGSSPLSSVSIAKRMSWAAQRRTTRVEDMAYCLLGIFDVSMPMIYGEDSRAFNRLQEEILRMSTDLSIFAWQAVGHSKYRGILAESPAEFMSCGNIELSNDQFRFRDEISLTNKGVKINIPIQDIGHETFILDLHCCRVAFNQAPNRVGVYLRRALDTYYRFSPRHQIVVEPGQASNLPRPIFLARARDEGTLTQLWGIREQRICVRFPKDVQCLSVHNITAVPEIYWKPRDRYFSLRGLSEFVCFVRFSVTSRLGSRSFMNREAKVETASFILVCDLVGGSKLKMGFCAESDFQTAPLKFINPVTNVEYYGPIGDPFSLNYLREEAMEAGGITRNYEDSGLKYVLEADLDDSNAPHFNVSVSIRVS